jgi:hypothetical protein
MIPLLLGALLGLPSAAQSTDSILSACETARAVAARVLSLETRLERDVAVTDAFAPSPAPERRGCRIYGRSDDDRIAAPVDDLFVALQAVGWHLVLEYMADGPDGSVVGMIVGPALCIIDGNWDGGDDSDTTYVPVPGYDLEVRCFRRAPNH